MHPFFSLTRAGLALIVLKKGAEDGQASAFHRSQRLAPTK